MSALGATVAANVGRELKRRYWTSDDLSEASETCRPCTRRWLKDGTRMTLVDVDDLARGLGVDPFELLLGPDVPPRR